MPDYTGCDGCLLPFQQLVNTVNATAELLLQLDPMSDCAGLTTLNQCCAAQLTGPQLQTVLTQLLACISEAITSGVLSGVVCENEDPVDPPTGTCSLYYRPDNGGLWFWNDGTSSWIQLIAP